MNPLPKASSLPRAKTQRLLACCALSLLLAPGAAFAQTTARQRIAVPQDPADAMLASALAAIDRNDFDGAAAELRDYLSKKPNDANAHFQLGYVYTALRRPDDARAEFERAVEINPALPEAELDLGLTLLEKTPALAIAPLRKAVELMPEKSRPQFLLGRAFELLGKATEAIEHYREAEKLDSEDSGIHLALGRALLTASKAPDAESEFRKAVALQPDAAAARLGLAQSLFAQKKMESAAAEYGTYLAAQPDDQAARLEHASVLEHLERHAEALTELDRAAAGEPETLQALKLRSLIFYNEKKYDDAVPVLQKAQALAPQDPDVPARLGHVYLEKKNYADAVRVLVVAIQANPSATDVLKDLVAAQYLNKNYPAALQGIDLLAKREPLPAGSWFIRATCYDKIGQPAQALDAYEKFLQLNKDENNDMYFEASSRVRFLKRELENHKR